MIQIIVSQLSREKKNYWTQYHYNNFDGKPDISDGKKTKMHCWTKNSNSAFHHIITLSPGKTWDKTMELVVV